MGSIGITYEASDRRTMHIYNISGPINNTDSILLVEDALETGRSLAGTREILKRDAMTVRTAAYYYKPDSVITPDYAVQMITQVPEFPWE
jgi:hypoxanthine-guanine phosphoribosyltransferase